MNRNYLEASIVFALMGALFGLRAGCEWMTWPGVVDLIMSLGQFGLSIFFAHAATQPNER